MKRGVFSLGSPLKIRVSKPGIDVDSAGPNDFLLHESWLFSQPYFFKFVACPFAGDSSKGFRDETVAVAIPNVTADPAISYWPADSTGAISYPTPRSTGAGSSASGFAVEGWNIYVLATSSTNLNVRFTKSTTSLSSPQGAYIVLARK